MFPDYEACLRNFSIDTYILDTWVEVLEKTSLASFSLGETQIRLCLASVVLQQRKEM